ncbi:MAG: carotenoid oxygenase family protein [Myxococcota bacterium]
MADYASNARYQVVPLMPISVESTHTEFVVDGAIPETLSGLYVRNGPNALGDAPPFLHYFSGEGMLHGVRLHEGRAEWYRSRVVRGGQVAERLGEPDIGGPVAHEVDASPNTNVIRLDGKLYATIEGGANPVALSSTLDSLHRSDFDGALTFGFTGHHKTDPESGEIFGVVYSKALPLAAQVVRLSPEGALLHSVEVPLAGATQIHDMAITKNYVIILDLSVVFDPVLLERTTLPIRWDGEKACRVGVMPKDGGASAVRWFDLEPCYAYHTLNAYEDDRGNVVVDVSRYPRAAERDLFGPLGDSLPTLDRWVLTMDGSTTRAVETRLSELPLDFLQVNPNVVGRRHRYAYAVEASLDPAFGGWVRVDTETGETLRQDLGGSWCSELTFVPRGTDEDDGWLLGFAFLPERRRSRLVILDASSFGSDPVASIWIPDLHVPIGTHGGWFPDL